MAGMPPASFYVSVCAAIRDVQNVIVTGSSVNELIVAVAFLK